MHRGAKIAHRDLARLSLFQDVGLESVEAHLEACREVRLDAGRLLLSPEQANDEVYGILQGSLDVRLNGQDATPLVTLEPGACVGEMSIIDGKKPSAYVVAREDSRLLGIKHETLWAMCNAEPTIARNLLALLTERLRTSNQIIADNEDILRQFERSAMTDALTQLNNRHWLQDMFRRKLARCKRDGSPVSLIMLDIDHFKTYNDRHGHRAGDRVLCRVADVLRTHVRPNDMVARYGGDEFAILLPDADIEAALITAERVRRGISRYLRRAAKRGDQAVSASLGIAQMEEADTLDSLLNKADFALYRAKVAGRDCVAQ